MAGSTMFHSIRFADKNARTLKLAAQTVVFRVSRHDKLIQLTNLEATANSINYELCEGRVGWLVGWV